MSSSLNMPPTWSIASRLIANHLLKMTYNKSESEFFGNLFKIGQKVNKGCLIKKVSVFSSIEWHLRWMLFSMTWLQDKNEHVIGIIQNSNQNTDQRHRGNTHGSILWPCLTPLGRIIKTQGAGQAALDVSKMCIQHNLELELFHLNWLQETVSMDMLFYCVTMHCFS